MTYCTNCGGEIEPGYAYCENCGAEVRTELRQATTDSIALASLGKRAGAIVIDTLIMWFFWGLLVFLMV